MEKPELIIALEKELDTTFTEVPIEEIIYWKSDKLATYTINNVGEIVGLKISDFELKRLPNSIKAFQNVEILDLSLNQLTDISILSQLKQIRTLYLNGNQLTDISALSHLKQITTLNLSKNQLTDISVLSQLKQLTALYLSNNRLIDISTLSYLKQLETLDLKNNQITDISALHDLKQLKQLGLQKNPIKVLPEWICDFPNMDIQWKNTFWGKDHITLYDNPLQEPPIEIVKQGKEAICNYFKKKKEEGTDYLYEAKLILVGEERAGKSTIAKALLRGDNFKFDANEKSTEGIDILKWIIPKDKTKTPKDFRFNIWDFGGQEIYHSMHQLFLTKRSLYVFLTEVRKDLRFDDFYYWLNIINVLGGDSPVLAVKNKIDLSNTSNDISAYKKLFPQLINDNLIGISCYTAHEKWATEYMPLLNIFKEKIYEVVKNKQIASMGTPLPKTWVQVREEITKLQDQGKDYISLADYQTICKRYNLDDTTISSLSQLFHDLGVFSHFQNNIKLYNTIFINPNYITTGIYKIINNNNVIKNNGEFTDNELIQILKNTEYVDKQAELISLCEEFNILFEYKKGHYLIPKLFSNKKPLFEWEHNINNLKYEYKYPFIIKGIVSQLIVIMHEKIYHRSYWLRGVILKENDTLALIEEKKGGVSIEVNGENKEKLLNIICYELDKINKQFTNLNIYQGYVKQKTTKDTFLDDKKCNKMPCALKQLLVKDYKGIKKIELGRLPVDAQWIFLTGENGYGKTSILQAIVAGFVGKDNDNVKIKNGKIIVEYLQNNNSVINNIDNVSFLAFNNFVAYGSSRLLTQGQRQVSESDEIRTQKTSSIFREDGILKDIEGVLIFWNNKGDKKYDIVKDLFRNILPDFSDIVIEDTQNKAIVKYIEGKKDNYPPVLFSDLAAGYKSIIAMIGDMIIRLLEYQPELDDLKELSGIVIIDEFDLHLHPKWQKKFVEILTDEFPKIQFIVSTHSAIPLLGAPRNSIFLNVDRTVDKGVTIQRIDIDIKNLLPNSLLTSPLFDFQDIVSNQYDDKNDDVHTEDYFNEIQFDEELKKQLEHFVNKNKPNVEE